ncbi:MAG: 16S rRNA (uracil(1498)-N(3))-methyltransferase [Prochlorococcaceae cyanobacterium]|nr:16S rRNA (uracil(1498)-N(3))-methyltransferase [Synechococcaceae bacterium WB4_1_0192]
MNIVLLQAEDWLGDGLAIVRDRRAVHIREVLRAAVGDSIRVGQLGGLCGRGLIAALEPAGVTLRVELCEPPPPRHRFDIVLALPRPKMLRRILRQCAEFGVANLHLINSARVEKSYWQTPLLQPAKLKEALLMGLERSRDTVLPTVHLHKRFRPFVEDHLPALSAGRPCWIADMGARLSLADAPPLPAVVLIGPEGGFVPFEVELAEAMNAQRVGLGQRILSVDTAFTAVLAQALPGSG